MKKLFYIFLCFLWAVFSPKVEAQTIHYVSPLGISNGSSWANASNDIQAMITAATSGDEIWVAAGTYKPNAYPSTCIGCSYPQDVTFHLKDSIRLYGGFVGTETLRAQRNWKTNVTTLSGDLNGDDVGFTNNTDNASHVVSSVSDGVLMVLDGFVIIGGNGLYDNPINIENQMVRREDGGGMVNYASSPTISNCIFKGNVAYIGGGMFNIDCSPTINNCTFSGNAADGAGGIYNGNINAGDPGLSYPVISNTTFSGNTASFSGGAMENYGNAYPTISNCTFTGNSADVILNWGGNPTITNCIIWDNYGGGGTVTYSIIQGGYSGTGNSAAAPLFFNATDPDGIDNIWHTADDGLSIVCGSPAINASDPAVTTPAIDITGYTRTGIFDIGAYEFQDGGLLPLTLSSTTPTICTGGTATITLNAGTGTSAYTWQQSTNGGASWYSVTGTTPTTTSITTGAMTASRMFRLIYNTTTCGTQTTPTFTLNVVPDPVVTVAASNNNFCAGGNTTLSASLSGGTGTGVYQWQQYISTTWTNIAGATASNYTTSAISANTNYKVLASQTGTGCVATGTNTANIIVKTLPNIYTNPTSANIINGNSITLHAYNAASYNWSPATGLNTSTGATVIASPSTSITYIITGIGTNGCSKAITLPITVSYSTDIAENRINHFSIFPNPTDRNISISMNTSFSQSISFCISDILGKVLTQWEGKSENGVYENEISIENLSQGVYFLSVKIGERAMTQKFVKE